MKFIKHPDNIWLRRLPGFSKRTIYASYFSSSYFWNEFNKMSNGRFSSSEPLLLYDQPTPVIRDPTCATLYRLWRSGEAGQIHIARSKDWLGANSVEHPWWFALFLWIDWNAPWSDRRGTVQSSRRCECRLLELDSLKEQSPKHWNQPLLHQLSLKTPCEWNSNEILNLYKNWGLIAAT